MNNTSSYPIDFVVLWVDGSDPEWLAKRQKYDPSFNTGNASARYRDWGIFKYWFRSVEKNAPWVNHIYVVTDSQKPNWLDERCSKITIVDHRTIMKEQYLPTFNSQAIEMNLHRIPGLSEHFVYFNDDTFLINKTKPTDFFKWGQPVEMANLNSATGMQGDQLYAQTMFNNILLINRHFDKKQVVNKNIFKWINLKYGINFNLRTLSQMPYPYFTGYRPQHLSTSLTKKTFEEVWAKEQEILENTCSHKFRHKDDVNQDVFVQWQLCTGNFVPRANSAGKYVTLKDRKDLSRISRIMKSRNKMLCINDGIYSKMDEKEIEHIRTRLIKIFDNKFPSESSYEK